MRFSIIIPSYNSENYLSHSLRSIFSNGFEDFEVIVVDCSTSDKPKLVCSNFPLTFVNVQSRFSPGIGRNIGATHAKGDYLIFMDSDIEIFKNTLDMLDKYLEEGIYIMGPALVLASNSTYKFTAIFEHLFFNSESQQTRPASIRKNLSSAFLVIKKELHVSSGGFKDIKRMQDTEYTERLSASGYSLRFNPSIVVKQFHDSKFFVVLRKIYINGFNSYALKKNTINHFFVGNIFFIMLMGLAKTSRICLRVFIYDFSFKNMVVIPAILISGIIWSFGFFSGLKSNGKFYEGR